MLLGFKRRFEPLVLDHSKRHTIRAKRKQPPSVGDRCDCYGDSRQKTMHLLGRWQCVKVEDIRIVLDPPVTHGFDWSQIPLHMVDKFEDFPWFVRVWIEGVELDRNERNALAWADGFRPPRRRNAFAEMVRFWLEEHGKGKRLDFRGDIIHWNPEIALPGPSEKLRARKRAAA